MTQAISNPGIDQASLTLAQASAPASGVVKFWRWWTAELKALLPAAMAIWLEGDTVATNVGVDDAGVTIFSSGDATKSAPQRVPNDALATSPALRELQAAGRDRVRLLLTPDQALVKTITLPLATEENLREVIGFELDRHTPFTPDQAYYDVQTVRRDPQHEKITVALAVASKFEIAALVERLRRAGLTCTAIGISEGAGAAGNAALFDLQPLFDKPPRRLSRMHIVNLGLLALAAMFAFAAIILPIWQQREAVKILNPQAAKSGAEFLISERVYTEYTKLAAEHNFLASRKHAVYPVLTVFDELARTFQDTTWVQRLDIKINGKVRELTVLGEAQSASKVIENLEQSPQSLFQNSKQLTQTIRMQPNTERFHVSAEIKPRPVPAMESIDDMVAAPVVAPTAPAATAPLTIPPATVTAAPATATVTTKSVTVTPPTPTQSLPASAPPSTTPIMPPPTTPNLPQSNTMTPLSTFNGPPPAPASAPSPKLPTPPTAPAGKRSNP